MLRSQSNSLIFYLVDPPAKGCRDSNKPNIIGPREFCHVLMIRRHLSDDFSPIPLVDKNASTTYFNLAT